MTTAILILIGMMWFPVALSLLGHGEARGTGFITLVVGGLVLITATIQAALFKDFITTGLLYVHGVFYCMVGYTFMVGPEDSRPMGNVALTTAIASTVYAIFFAVGGPLVEGTALWGASKYLTIMAVIYAILTYEVFAVAYGWLSAKVLAYCLVLGVIFSLWIPAFSLLAWGKLPFGW
jgi:hypothetical protein